MSKDYHKIQPQWWGKTAVDVFLGLALSYGIVTLIVWFGPDSINCWFRIRLYLCYLARICSHKMPELNVNITYLWLRNLIFFCGHSSF